MTRVAAALPDDHLAAYARAIEGRLASGEVYVAVVGQTNRGKSSLINALVGTPVLPTGIVPVTSVSTHVRFGERPAFLVHLPHGGIESVAASDLVEWIAADRNPGNARGADFVELRLPAPVLQSGLRLIDTPGVGSVDASAEAATARVLPHADAAIFVTGADPPFSAPEGATCAEVARWAPRVLVVMNKIDLVDAAERERTRQYLACAVDRVLGGPADGIAQVSAAAVLRGNGGHAEWNRLLDALADWTGRERAAILARGAERESDALVRYAIGVVGGRAHAAYQPVADCDRRVEAIRSADGRLAYATLMLSEFVRRVLARQPANEAAARGRALAAEAEVAAASLEALIGAAAVGDQIAPPLPAAGGDGIAPLEALDANWQARARACHTRADRVIGRTVELRARLDGPAHEELRRLAGLRHELEETLASRGTGEGRPDVPSP